MAVNRTLKERPEARKFILQNRLRPSFHCGSNGVFWVDPDVMIDSSGLYFELKDINLRRQMRKMLREGYWGVRRDDDGKEYDSRRAIFGIKEVCRMAALRRKAAEERVKRAQILLDEADRILKSKV